MSPLTTVADAMGNDGPLPTVNWNGKAYPVAYPTPEVIARAERQVAKLVWENMERMKGVLPPAAHAELRAETVSALQLGKTGFAQPLFTGVLDGIDGHTLILWACLTLKTPDVTFDQARAMRGDCPDEVDFALAQVVGGFFSEGSAKLPAPESERAMLAAALTAQMIAALAAQREARTNRQTASPDSPPC